MIKALLLAHKSKKTQKTQHKNAIKTSITQQLRTDYDGHFEEREPHN